MKKLSIICLMLVIFGTSSSSLATQLDVTGDIIIPDDTAGQTDFSNNPYVGINITGSATVTIKNDVTVN